MELKQFRYSRDNLGYLLYGDSYAIAVDGGAPAEMLEFLSSSGLDLRRVANTHSHADHTCGNLELLEKTDADLIAFEVLRNMDQLELEGERITVIHTPGHTAAVEITAVHYVSGMIAGGRIRTAG